MYLLNLTLPIILLITSSLMGRKLGIRGVSLISICGILLLLINNIWMWLEIISNGSTLTIELFNWINCDIMNLRLIFIFDDLSVTMLTVINSVTFLVLLYSYDYMINDPHGIRFMNYIVLFVLCMIILVTSISLPLLFIGWEGVGITSFLLISFWFTRIETSLGGLLAIIMNRIGDTFFLLAIISSILLFGTTDIPLILAHPSQSIDLFLFAILIAAMAKSAQLGLHIWLPYSMEGPTPISALLHAATMVTAGVFLLLRLSLLISYSYKALIAIIIIGALTLFIGGTMALTSLDMKELIAYSTMSQLGYMITIMGLKYTNLSFYHLVLHAYFKALLFLTAGSIIHSILDLQDLRIGGALIRFLPFSYLVGFIGLTSLAGFPFTTGFYSKESIINASFFSHPIWGEYVYIFTLITAFFTVAYSYKFILTIFIRTPNLSLFTFKNIHYYSLHLFLSLFILTIIVLFIGYFSSKWIYLYNLPINFYHLSIPIILKWIPLSFFPIIIFIYTYIKSTSSINIQILSAQYHFKILYASIASLFLALGYRILFKLFDYGFLDLLFPLTGEQLLLFSNKISSNTTADTNSSYYFSFLLTFTFLFLLFL